MSGLTARVPAITMHGVSCFFTTTTTTTTRSGGPAVVYVG